MNTIVDVSAVLRPLMVMVQKITLVAFALHDGEWCQTQLGTTISHPLPPSLSPGKARLDSELNKDQRQQKILSTPGLLQYFSYMFNFHSLLAGPSSTMKEYLAFMDGSNFQPSSDSTSTHVSDCACL